MKSAPRQSSQPPTTIRQMDHVQILLGVLNGAAHLSEQLESLTRQNHTAWSLLISDDGSDDNSMEITARFGEENPQHQIKHIIGPHKGFAQNYLHLLRQSDPTAAYVAFCDQDDVWLEPKLTRALAQLAKYPATQPAMICGRTLHCQANLSDPTPSPLHSRPPGFANALIQNLGGGNTIVLNRAARDLLVTASAYTDGIVSHDWWMYQVMTGIGATVIYDAEPQLLYRQHDRNAVGAREGFLPQLRRIRSLFHGRFRGWNDANIRALMPLHGQLTSNNQTLLNNFIDARDAPIWQRPFRFLRLGLYRQRRIESTLIWLAAVFRRV